MDEGDAPVELPIEDSLDLHSFAPQDIADVVALLVSDDANWITGQNIRANGGTI